MVFQRNISTKVTLITVIVKTTRLIREAYNEIPIVDTFQSRFGPEEWLKPYTDKTLEVLPSEGKKTF